MTATEDRSEGLTFDEHIDTAVQMAYDMPGVEHIWMNGFSCIQPTDEFAARVGRDVIRKVMESRGRHVVLRINAS